MNTVKKPAPTGLNLGTKPGPEPWSMDAHWPELVGSLASQITEGLAGLQQQLDQLHARERLARPDHMALSAGVQRLRHAGMVAQQIQRFHSGRIRQSHEKIHLAELIEDLLQERRREFATLGVGLRRKLRPADVLMDPTVTYAFVNAAIDWALPFGRRVDVRLDINNWPPHARLQVRATHDGTPASSQADMDGLGWLLIRQIAETSGGIELTRQTHADGVGVTALFTRTVQSVDGMSAIDLADDASSMFRSLQGVYALTVSPSLQIRADVRDALREIGISSDSVVDLAQAREALRHRWPSLIVVDADLRGSDFDAFRRDVGAEQAECAFVEISPDDSAFDMSGFDETSMARVGRGNIRGALGTAVMFELAKAM